MHLYHRLHYVYAFGIGEASAAELITIVILSVFLFYSSFYAEVHLSHTESLFKVQTV